ncbi:MAG: branched-chain amino acid ABC transporter permease [Proteobacteria bacterium]|nr:branched-chain amino acid ABC transporter permease [Pseudomonadota bacterium]MBU1449751.1 branched-chain amino acid ABC transporter permease [Pseudomonadota bacterium]MBU2468988.1 branched-chain amino acid ABC transporter permease [Pseudomonadota bacterium]MBU2517256.1 branched-chain amino acid ABC transporter permease [Pseudomonadota bacterium]
MTTQGKRFFLALAALAAVLAALPLVVTNPYYLNVLNVVALNVLVVTGLNLLIGFAGQISLGHAAFFGLGAYISGILTGTHGWEPWTALVLAAAVVALVALVIGMPTLRLEGNYLVMATLGFNLIVSVLMLQLDDITGGPSGYTGIPPLTFFGAPIATDLSFYWLAWGAVLLGLLLARNLVHSRVGRGLKALHEAPLAAAASGVPIESYKVKVFVVSAVYASVAGSLYAHYYGIITPKTFDIFKSVELVTMCIVGGMGSLWGGLFGAALLTPLPQLLAVVEEYKDIFFGGILLLLLIFLPQGLVGWLEGKRVRPGGRAF